MKNYSLSRIACSLIPDNCLSLSELDERYFFSHSTRLSQNPQLQVKTIVAFAFHRNDTSLQDKHSCNTHTKMKWETILVSLLCLEVVICRNGSHVSRAGAHTGDCRFFLSLSVCESGNVSSTNSIHVATLLLLSCRIASSASNLKFRATATARTTGRLRCWSATTEKRPAKRSARVWVSSVQ